MQHLIKLHEIPKNIEGKYDIPDKCKFRITNQPNTSITIDNINKYVEEIKAIEAEIEQASTWADTLRQTMAKDLNRLEDFQIERKSEGWFSSLKK